MVASTKQLWFFNFIGYACFFYVCSSVTPVSAIYPDSFQPERHAPHNNYYKDRGLSHNCSQNVHVKKLTNPFSVSEGPFWSVDLRSLLFVDGARGTICRYAVHTEELFCAKLGNDSVQDIIPLKNVPHKYFSTYGANLTIVSWDAISTEASFQTLEQATLPPDHFVNDAKADPRGVVFFFTEPKVPPTGLSSIPRHQSELYNIINGKKKTLLTKFTFGNGIAFSPCGEFLYHSDSEINCTYESYYDRATNSIKNTRVLIDYIKEGIPCFPDSMTVDKEGNVWTTCNRGSRILKVQPHTGNILCSIELPAVAPTNLAFGECPGKKNKVLNCLYVTTERVRLMSPTPDDGALYLIENSGSEGYEPNKVDLKEFIHMENDHLV